MLASRDPEYLHQLRVGMRRLRSALQAFAPILQGERPLKRTLQRRLLDPLALAVLQGEFGEGDTIRADARDGALVLNRETDAEQVPASRT